VVAPKHSPPLPATLQVWQQNQNLKEAGFTPQPQFPNAQWWTQFHDAQLACYLEEAFQQSPTLHLAVARIQEAEGVFRQTRANELPGATLQTDYSRQRNSATLIAPNIRQFAGQQQGVGAGGTNGTSPATGPIQPRLFAPGQVLNFYNMAVRASYELDYLLKNRMASRADKEGVRATQWDLRAAQLTLMADVATAYFNLLLADQRVSLQQAVVALHRQTLGLLEAREAAGLIPGLDVTSASTALALAEANLTPLQQNQAVFSHQLAVLLGRTPGQPMPRASWKTFVAGLQGNTALPVGLPGELLTRRPDLLAAQAQLNRARLLSQVARRRLFPSIVLNGQFGLASTNLQDFFDWDSRLWSFGGSLVQDVFAGGARLAALRIEQSRYRQQWDTYRDAVLRAYREVEDQLAALKRFETEQQHQHRGVVANAQRLALLEAREAAGLNNGLDTLEAQRQWLEAQQLHSQALAQVWVSKVNLYRALGGGF
jgi:NodT family efflux transporter outer membrane factor (OMF) lipoprotein